jgi:hypothetical protein
MTLQPRKIDFDEFAANVRRVFDAMEREQTPIVVERAGQLYRVEPQGTPSTETIWAQYDANHVRQALRASRGALTGVDRAALLADLRAERGQDSTGRPAE